MLGVVRFALWGGEVTAKAVSAKKVHAIRSAAKGARLASNTIQRPMIFLLSHP
ncbi:hypothetical protein AM1_0923 [Acaryochloris marina MBIC11017]|uniref:Uncharacterized protein n=1 Tax=Acaryochloris marina (strain MBIC 11017) TaxID=329726 RepID=B0BZN9_ACAM1|nr:hypothetical protein AM1_0923 [Acaryochloris marina MBIC11017]